MSRTDSQRALHRHVVHFRDFELGYRADQCTYTGGEDHVEGDEVFAMLETPTAVYLFSLAKDAGTVDRFALWGEAAVLTQLALMRLVQKAVARA